jgi:branched-chain amino acid transport system substrate-binding protein
VRELLRLNRIAAAGIAATALVLSGCSASGGGTGDTIRIGAPLAITGSAGTVGLDMKDAAELGIEQINEAGGVDGRKLELVLEDTAGEAAQAVQVTTTLAKDPNVLALLGPVFTGEVGATTSIAGANKIVMIPPLSAGHVPGIENGKFNDYTFRIAQAFASYQGASMSKVIEFQHADHVTVINIDDNPVYVDAAKIWTAAAEASGAKVDHIAFPSTQVDLSSIISSIDRQTDVIALGGLPPQVGPLANAIRQAGIEAQLMGENALLSRESYDSSRGAAEGSYAATVFFPDASKASADFAKAFRAKYDREPTTFSAMAYDAVNLIARAAKEGGATRSGIQKTLSTLQGFEGATGTLGYNGSGDAIRKSIPMVQVGPGGTLKDSGSSITPSVQ